MSGPGCWSGLHFCELEHAHSLKLGWLNGSGWNRAALADLFACKVVRGKSGRAFHKVAKAVYLLAKLSR